METRLSRICNAIIEAGWLTALVVAPLFFNTFSNRVFEPDKLHLVRSIALLMAVAWIVQLLDSGLRRGEGAPGLWLRIRRTPLVLPALVLVVSYLLSTALSVVPRISFFGSYVRMQGTFSYLSYITIFVMILTNLRTRDQVSRLLHTVILTSLPISIYGIIQNAGLDPLPWGGDVRSRVAANMGNAIFVAAYLIMAAFLTLERLLDSLTAMLSAERGSLADSLRAGGYLFILVVQLIAIVYTQSRGPWLGLFAGLYVFAMLGLLLLARGAAQRDKVPAALAWLARHLRAAWLTLIGVSLAGLIFLVTLNVPNGPLSGACEQRYIGRLCSLLSLSDGTNAVRVLIWEGVADMMLTPHAPIQQPDGTPDALNPLRPLVGYGPESMWVAYNRFYPADLAHYESRNASPDRSHNETFDTLVRGGLFQFAAQLVLYSAIFYYALHWLGLMRGAARRRWFFAFLIIGGALGVIVPLLVDGSLRLAGIGLPAGLIAGVIVYVTVDLLFSGDRGLRGETDAPVQVNGRRQLLLLALFAAIVAHFVEVHFGIAIASTLTHFWAFAALLVVVGMGWLRAEVAPTAVPAPVAVKPEAATTPLRTAGPKRKGSKATATSPARNAPRQPTGAPLTPAPAPPTALRRFLPHAAIAALVTLVLVWNYTVNQTGTSGAFAILRNAFTVRVNNYQAVSSPMLLVLVLFTWLVGGMLAVTETARTSERGSRLPLLRAVAIYMLTVIGVFLVFGLIQAGRLNLEGLSGLAVYRRFANHIVVFDIALLVLAGVVAAAILFAGRGSPRGTTAPMFGRSPALSLGAGALLAALALLIIVNVNIQTVQADTYYKSGLGFEGAGDWESAVVLYGEAAVLEPQEDYYYLFLGRALLQLGQYAQPGNATLPENLDETPTTALPGLIQRGLRAGNREDILRAAHAALVSARRLNPLNTDHSANLARLHRAWAFTDAGTAANVNAPDSLRELLISDPNLVHRDRLERAVTYYRQAIALSPNNAGLWNELSTVQFIMNDLAAARTTLEHSLTLDPRFYSTYLSLGDTLDAAGDPAAALVAYKQAAEFAPNNTGVLSAVGVFSAQTGDVESALDAFQGIIARETKSLESAIGELDRLDAMAANAGGYARLLSSATNRQGTLQGQINSRRSQIYLSYRNIALVLRDAGRTAEALAAAQQAAEYVGQNDRPAIEQLIADLQGQLNP